MGKPWNHHSEHDWHPFTRLLCLLQCCNRGIISITSWCEKKVIICIYKTLLERFTSRSFQKQTSKRTGPVTVNPYNCHNFSRSPPPIVFWLHLLMFGEGWRINRVNTGKTLRFRTWNFFWSASYALSDINISLDLGTTENKTCRKWKLKNSKKERLVDQI